MNKIAKSGVILAMLIGGTAEASIVNVNLSGTVSNGYAYENNWSSYSNLNGQNATLSLAIDTTAPKSGYDYNYDYGWGYQYSYSEQYYQNPLSSFNANVGGHTVSQNNLSSSADLYNQNYWGSNYNYMNLYGSSNTGSSYKDFEIYGYGNQPINTNDLVASLLAGNSLSFYLYSYDWNIGSYLYSYGAINSASINPSQVPIPAAVWLFGSALAGLMGIMKKKVLA